MSNLPKPPEPHIGSIDGRRYMVKYDYLANFADWMAPLQFLIPAGTITDIASVPWWLRWACDRAGLGITAPLLHDLLCALQGSYVNVYGQKVQLSWFDAHLFFLVAMRLDGIPAWKALLAFLVVLIGNRPIWKTDGSN